MHDLLRRGPAVELQRAAAWLIAVLLILQTASAYTLTVYAKDSESGTSIDSFYAKLNDVLKTTTSGSIAFDNVEGEYRLEVWAENYATASYTVNVSKDMTITAYLTPLETSWVVSFKVYRCFKPVRGVLVTVNYNGNSTGSGYTDETGSVAFRLDRLKSYVVNVNDSEKVVTVQPVENNYVITLPCNLSQEWETATYNVTTGSYAWDLLTTAQNLSSQLSPSARGFLSGLVAWMAMYGVSAVGVNAAPVGVIALVGLAVVGLADWVAVLLCCVFMVAMYVLRRGIG